MKKCTFIKLQNSQGFTLIELMVVIIIAAILLTIAVPSFESLIKKNNVEALQSRLSSALSTARTEAASRNTIVTICSANDAGTTCSTAADNEDDWGNGWLVFEGTGNTPAVTAIIEHYTRDDDYTVKAGSVGQLSFNSQGFLTGAATSGDMFTVCEPDKELTYARGIYVNQSGLIVKSKDTDATPDGIHNSLGAGSVANLACP